MKRVGFLVARTLALASLCFAWTALATPQGAPRILVSVSGGTSWPVKAA
jgi:hypothetical protein